MKRQLFLAGLFISIAILLTACGGQAAPATVVPKSTTMSSEVAISNFSYMPNELQVKVGTTVMWTNNDSVNHTVTADNGAFDSGPFDKGATYSFTFNEAGTFSYHCTIHPKMTGVITVVQ
jgi:plastocyanin